jgi:hypothetical protein
MSDLMSLTQVTRADVIRALSNRSAALARQEYAVALATPKYKATLNLRWWNFLAKRMTSTELLRREANHLWSSQAYVLYNEGLITLDEYVPDRDYGIRRVVKTLAASGKESFLVNEDVLEYINNWINNAP